MKGVFVIGTDTNVGKTYICAGILKMLHGSRPVAFWKPIQTGTILGDDLHDVKDLTGLPPECYVSPAYRFAEPLAPHMAAKRWGKTVDLEMMAGTVKHYLDDKTFLIVEGAGGVYVPYTDEKLQIDFMKMAGLPVIVVGQDRVGQINQMLLTLDALRDYKLEVLGVILTKMRGSFGNAESISKFGKVEILAQIPDTPNRSSFVSEVGTNDRLRSLFNIPILP